MYLMLSLLVKISDDNIDKKNFQKIVFDISCKFSPIGDNLYEMLNPFFWEKQEKIVNLLSAEFAQRALKKKLGSVASNRKPMHKPAVDIQICPSLCYIDLVLQKSVFYRV